MVFHLVYKMELDFNKSLLVGPQAKHHMPLSLVSDNIVTNITSLEKEATDGNLYFVKLC